MGSNDINDVNYLNNSNKTPTENLNDIINVIFNTTENMYKVGARNFLFINISPFDLSPSNAGNKRPFYKDQVQLFNQALEEHSKTLFNKYDDINIIVYDNNSQYKYVMANYSHFQFKEGSWNFHKKENMDNFFWRDFTHITNKGNRILAEDIDLLLNSLK